MCVKETSHIHKIDGIFERSCNYVMLRLFVSTGTVNRIISIAVAMKIELESA
jgi:hypothetical protein